MFSPHLLGNVVDDLSLLQQHSQRLSFFYLVFFLGTEEPYFFGTVDHFNKIKYLKYFCIVSHSLLCVTPTWREMACIRSQVYRAHATHAFTPPS